MRERPDQNLVSAIVRDLVETCPYRGSRKTCYEQHLYAFDAVLPEADDASHQARVITRRIVRALQLMHKLTRREVPQETMIEVCTDIQYEIELLLDRVAAVKPSPSVLIEPPRRSPGFILLRFQY
jgi:hypothetical protein